MPTPMYDDSNVKPLTSDNDAWNKAIHLLTGYKAPDRHTLFDSLLGNEGIPQMKVEISKQGSVDYVDPDDFQWRIDNAGYDINNTDFVIPFYKTGGDDPGSGDQVSMYKARITMLGHKGSDGPKGGVVEGGEFKSQYDNHLGLSGDKAVWTTGPVTQYAYGTGRALEAVLNNYDSGSHGFSWNGVNVLEEAAVSLKSFDLTAGAFDRVAQFFQERQQTIAEWQRRVGTEQHDAWRGQAAGVFWHLIDTLNRQYEGYAKDLGAEGGKSKQGNEIRDARSAFRTAAYDLWSEWATWELLKGNPLTFLNDLLVEITDHVWENNITQISYKVNYSGGAYGSYYTTYHADANFSQTATRHGKSDNFGQLDDLSTWKAVGERAVQNWQASIIKDLEGPANEALDSISRAWSSKNFDLGSIRTRGEDSLTSSYQEDKSELEKEEAERKEKEAEEAAAEAQRKQDEFMAWQKQQAEEAKAEQERKEKEAEEKEAAAKAEQERKEREAEEKQAQKEKEAEEKEARLRAEQEAKEAEAKAEQERKEKEAEAKQAEKEKEAEQKQAEMEAKQEQKEQEAKAEQERKEQEAEQKQQEAETKAEQLRAEQEAKQEEAQKKQEEAQARAEQMSISQFNQSRADQDAARKEQERQRKEAEAEAEAKQAELEAEQEAKEKEAEQKQQEAEAEQERKEQEAEAKQAEAEKEAEERQAQAQEEQRKLQTEQELRQEQLLTEQEKREAERQAAEDEARQKQEEAIARQEQAFQQAGGQLNPGGGNLPSIEDILNPGGVVGSGGLNDSNLPGGVVDSGGLNDGGLGSIRDQLGSSPYTDDMLTNPGGSETTLDDGRLVTEYPDGSKVEIDPRTGEATITRPDGTVETGPLNRGDVLPNPDGSTSYLDEDGNIVTEYPDGTVTEVDPDTGVSRTTQPDGTVSSGNLNAGDLSSIVGSIDGIGSPYSGDTLTNPGGSETTLDNGRQVTEYPDGTKVEIDPEMRTTTVTQPDGTVETGPLNPGDPFTNPDGSTSYLDSDGRIVTEFPDGTVTEVDPETGNSRTTLPDGTVRSGNLNGSLGDLPSLSGTGPGSSSSYSMPSPSYSSPAYGFGDYEEELYDESPYDSPYAAQASDGNTGRVGTPLNTASLPGGLGLRDLNGGTDASGTGGMPMGGMPMGGMGGMGGAGAGNQSQGERVRNVIDEAQVTNGRGGRRGAGAAARSVTEENDVRVSSPRASATTGSSPFMPMGMGGAGAPGGPGQTQTQSGDRAREVWAQEDDDVWGTDEGGAPAVIGR
ncbi:AAWKG family protein [Streptomyces sp. CRN 30]|uniref:AAWKG family protein n=1 Tax=Streptomyces sp. CRN 30 TaxID=3075613 RepID=UPI002A839ED2|nr:AAWKG family protein [Streptomyces sp. CRN 30]